MDTRGGKTAMVAIGTHAVRNGVVIKAAEAVLPIQSKEVQFGFGVYESLKVIQGQVLYLKDHLQRLYGSADGLGLRHPYASHMISQWITALLAVDGVREATLRILLMGGSEPVLYITAMPMLSYPDTWYRQGVSVTTYNGERFLPHIKSCSLLLNYLALRAAQEAGAFEALLVDREGRVLEGTRSNFFACRGDVVHTAPDDLVLEGVTRDKILKAIRQLGFRISFDSPTLAEVSSGYYDELFISSTSMGALPVAAVDGKACGSVFSHSQAIHSLIGQWELEALH
jgi:D-alanine transaminase/branched-chain amino acid aminotransferase